MEFSEFLQKFYMPDAGGGLVGYKSKKRIPMFFFEHGLVEEHDNDLLQQSDSTFEKWETGSRKPDAATWAAVLQNFDADRLQKGLLATLNSNNLSKVMERFNIALDAGELPDKLLLARAIVSQFRAIASGSGTAENIVPAEYKKPPELEGFGAYLREAKKSYSLIKLSKNEEGRLNDYFVCNNIGKSAVAFINKVRVNKNDILPIVTLSEIRKFGPYGEGRYTILIGACGYGKTLMLQHLFLDAADHLSETGMLPVLAGLSTFSSVDDSDLVSFLAKSVWRFDPKFTKEKLVDLLEKGQAQILLDGLDEMNPKEVKKFREKLEDFCHHYPNNQIVITSRQCSAVSGISGFIHLHIYPLDKAQTLELIDKLLNGVDDDKAKETVLSFMDTSNGYVRQGSFLATNPMLLTVIVKNYKTIQNYNGNKTKFYKLLYDTIIVKHDGNRDFDRFFHSVGDANEFTEVFREFCALSYVDGVSEFDDRTFNKYFKKLKSKESLPNPLICNLTNFQHDACSTACMMYEQDSDLHYIDRGFQDYCFAEFYFDEDSNNTKTMGRALWDRDIDSFQNLDALKMLHEIAKNKTETCILLPYLDSVFKGKSDEESFLRYLSYGFGNITYYLHDKSQIDRFGNEQSRKFARLANRNHTTNIVFSFLLEMLNLPKDFEVFTMDSKIKPDEFAKEFIAGYYADFQDDGVWNTYLMGRPYKIEYMGNNQYIQNLEPDYRFITDEKTGQIVIFGYVCKVDPLVLIDKPVQKKHFLELCKVGRVREMYESVKEFYQELVEKQQVNRYR